MKPYSEFIKDSTRPIIASHRAAWHTAPENSIAAINNAVRAGYDIAEIDIQQSIDGKLFLFHDRTLKRTVGHSDTVGSLTLKELKKMHLLEVDGGPNARVTKYNIPSLKEVLKVAKDKIYLDLDVKYSADLFGKIGEMVTKQNIQDQISLKQKIVDTSDIEHMRQLQLNYGIMPIPIIQLKSNEDTDRYVDMLGTLNTATAEIKFNQIDILQDAVERFAEQGISIWVNTLNNAYSCLYCDSRALSSPHQVWGVLLNAGVKVIQTDEPAALNRYIQRQTSKYIT